MKKWALFMSLFLAQSSFAGRTLLEVIPPQWIISPAFPEEFKDSRSTSELRENFIQGYLPASYVSNQLQVKAILADISDSDLPYFLRLLNQWFKMPLLLKNDTDHRTSTSPYISRLESIVQLNQLRQTVSSDRWHTALAIYHFLNHKSWFENVLDEEKFAILLSTHTLTTEHLTRLAWMLLHTRPEERNPAFSKLIESIYTFQNEMIRYRLFEDSIRRGEALPEVESTLITVLDETPVDEEICITLPDFLGRLSEPRIRFRMNPFLSTLTSITGESIESRSSEVLTKLPEVTRAHLQQVDWKLPHSKAVLTFITKRMGSDLSLELLAMEFFRYARLEKFEKLIMIEPIVDTWFQSPAWGEVPPTYKERSELILWLSDVKTIEQAQFVFQWWLMLKPEFDASIARQDPGAKRFLREHRYLSEEERSFVPKNRTDDLLRLVKLVQETKDITQAHQVIEAMSKLKGRQLGHFDLFDTLKAIVITHPTLDLNPLVSALSQVPSGRRFIAYTLPNVSSDQYELYARSLVRLYQNWSWDNGDPSSIPANALLKLPQGNWEEFILFWEKVIPDDTYFKQKVLEQVLGKFSSPEEIKALYPIAELESFPTLGSIYQWHKLRYLDSHYRLKPGAPSEEQIKMQIEEQLVHAMTTGPLSDRIERVKEISSRYRY